MTRKVMTCISDFPARFRPAFWLFLLAALLAMPGLSFAQYQNQKAPADLPPDEPVIAGGPKIPLAVPGEFHGDEVEFSDGDNAFLLVKIGQTYEIKSSKTKVERFNDVILDDQGAMTGKRLSWPGLTRSDSETLQKKPEIILAMKTRQLKIGPLRTASGYETCLQDQKGCEIDFGGDTYTLKITGKTETDGTESLYVYDIKLSGQTGENRIAGVNRILWAGDLDRDGRIDLIIDDVAHYSIWAGMKLYLSSYAKPGQLFGLAGSLTGTGC